jgi:pilus assembly protein CpaF
LHPAIVPGVGKNYPSMNIRLFEPKPVPPEQLIEWKVAPEEVVRELVDLVRRRTRVMVIGGTATGKTTLLSALCSGIPKEMRVVKLEDPEEIWVDHPHVVTVEARPVSPGAAITGYNLVDAVNDAMRMSPTYLIVGEVRKGDQALALFSAMMSDHPGLTTFHAEGPDQAINRIAILMYADAGVRMEAAKAYFAQAVDLIVQIGWPRDGDGNPQYDPDGAHRRKIIGVWEVVKELRGGSVKFKQIYQHGEAGLQELHHARKEGGHE